VQNENTKETFSRIGFGINPGSTSGIIECKRHQ